jgi:HD superfamily phosphohydrolase
MPGWGLDDKQRASAPWGLPEVLLKPGKVITDPIHGDVFITRLEQAILDTPPLQRLRRVRQLGTTQLVYPGATHSRFSHALGALRVVQDLLDVVIGQRFGQHSVPDLFAQWQKEADADEHDIESNGNLSSELALAADPGDPDRSAIRHRKKLAEAIVLARLGALLHDLGHVPFGHSIEDDLKLLVPHDENKTRFEGLWALILTEAERRLRRDFAEDSQLAEVVTGLDPLRPGAELYTNLRLLILSKEKDPTTDEPVDVAARSKYPFTADMVGNTICADLVDYLQRDHIFTGLPISLGWRYLSAFYVTRSDTGGIYPRRMALLLHRNGIPRKDVQTEVLKHLRYRYELQERVLVHHLKLTADAMVGKMIELWYDAELRRVKSMSARNQRALAREIPEAFEHDVADLTTSEMALHAVDATSARKPRVRRAELIVRWQLEQLFLHHGDDGLLELIASSRYPTAESPGGRAARLARALLDRDLYHHTANAAGAYAAHDLFKEFGGVEKRTELERGAAAYAGIDDATKVILWVPGPEMRLKLAEVLVDHGHGIAKFVDYSEKGSDIYSAHKELWTISLFTDREVAEPQRRAVAAWLAKKMGIAWDRYQRELGTDTSAWPETLAAMTVCEAEITDRKVRRLVDRYKDAAARASDELDHDALVAKMQAIADDLME